MELKSVTSSSKAGSMISFNRTFMELKSVSELFLNNGSIKVLIVPLWN